MSNRILVFVGPNRISSKTVAGVCQDRYHAPFYVSPALRCERRQ